MMKFGYAFLLTASFAVAGDAAYFPLEVGNQWIYQFKEGSIAGPSWTVEVTGKETVDGTDYFVLNGFPHAGQKLVRRSGSALVSYDPEAKVERQWVDFGAALGAEFESGFEDCVRSGKIAERKVNYDGAIGAYRNALKVEYGVSCADAGVTEDVFVPGAGLVRRVYASFGGPQTYELIYARVGRKSYGGASVGFSLNLDRVSYEPGAILRANLRLHNTTGQPLQLHFPSGQDFDIQIRNAKGDIVYTWSADKLFLAMLRDVTIEGEKNWVTEVPLQLEQGSYTATGTLSAAGAKYESTVPFTVGPGR